jgi:hypothetical protein
MLGALTVASTPFSSPRCWRSADAKLGSGTARPRKVEGKSSSARLVRHAICPRMHEGFGRQVLFAAKARTAPGPFHGGAHKTRFDRIVLDVADDAPEVFFVANVAVEIVVFPKGPLTAQNCCAPGESKWGRYFEEYQPLKPLACSSGASGSVHWRLASMSCLSCSGFMPQGRGRLVPA